MIKVRWTSKLIISSQFVVEQLWAKSNIIARCHLWLCKSHFCLYWTICIHNAPNLKWLYLIVFKNIFWTFLCSFFWQFVLNYIQGFCDSFKSWRIFNWNSCCCFGKMLMICCGTLTVTSRKDYYTFAQWNEKHDTPW